MCGWAGRGRRPLPVTEIDASTGSVVRTIAAGYSVTGISSDGTNVWVANGPTWNTITELDASTGVVVRTIHIPWGALRVSADGTHIWVSNRRGLEYSVTELNAYRTVRSHGAHVRPRQRQLVLRRLFGGRSGLGHQQPPRYRLRTPCIASSDWDRYTTASQGCRRPDQHISGEP